MNDPLFSLLDLCQHVVIRTLLPGSLAVILAWLVERSWPSMPPGWRSWLWRMVFVKWILLVVSPVQFALPVLPRSELFALVSPASSASSIDSRPGVHVDSGAASPEQNKRSRSVGELSSNGLPQPVPAERGTWRIVLLAIWSGVVCVGLGAFYRARWKVHCDARSARTIWNEPLRREVGQLALRFGLTRVPDVVEMEGRTSPCLIGGVRPVIAIPRSWRDDCSLAQLRVVIAHELAHLARRDLAWNHLVALCLTCFFYHPLLWLAARRYLLAQEVACDALALSKSKAPATDLMRILLHMGSQPSGSLLSGAAALSGTLSPLRERILAMQRSFSRPGNLLRLVTSAMVLLWLTPWTVAQSPESPGESLSKEGPRYSTKRSTSKGITVTASGGASGFAEGFGMGSGSGSASAGGNDSGSVSTPDATTYDSAPQGNSRGGSRSRARSRSLSRSMARSGSRSNVSVSLKQNGDTLESPSDDATVSLPSEEESTASTRSKLKPRSSRSGKWQRAAETEDDERRISVEENQDEVRVTIVDRESGEKSTHVAKNKEELASQSPEAYEAYREAFGEEATDPANALDGESELQLHQPVDHPDAQQLMREQLRKMKQDDQVRGTPLQSIIEDLERQIDR